MSRVLALMLGALLVACAEREAEELVERLKTRDPAELREVTGKLLRMNNSAIVPALRRGLQAEKWQTRYMSAQLLGKARAAEAIPDLISALDDTVHAVVAAAAEALGRLDCHSAVPRLIKLVDHSDEVVGTRAAEALGRIGSPSALGALCQGAPGRGPAYRAALVSALGPCHDYQRAPALSDSALSVSRRALGDWSVQVRIAGIVSLRAFDYVGAAGDLLRLLHDPSEEMQHVVVQALGEIHSANEPAWQGDADPDMSRIITALDSVLTTSPNIGVRQRATEALERIAAASLDTRPAAPR
ncbi:HEAT repeat domain-containing protein [Candidatus Latescibacterota bacterium]